MWSSRGLNLACLLLIAIAVLVPAVPASAAVEAEAEAVAIAEPAAVVATTPEAPVVVPTPVAAGEEAQPAPTSTRAARRAAKLDERGQRLAAERSRRRAEKQARLRARAEREPARPNVNLTVTCTLVEVHYHGFPNLPGNTVKETVSIEKAHLERKTFTFDGTEGTDVIPFISPSRLTAYHVDVHGKWRTNGFSGGYDLFKKQECPPKPSFTLQKLQRIAGSEGALTTEPLVGHTGQTVDYAFRVTNTGNVPLTFELFEDKYCDAGTLTRSTMSAIGIGEVLIYECTHLLTKTDEEAGSLTNVASVIGAPPSEFGLGPEEAKSNPVVITPITPAPPVEEKVITTPTPTPENGVLDTKTSSTGTSTTTTTGKTGVLGFSSATVPALKGPRGCVRGRFHASVKSTGVASVTFYVDGKKLKTLTSRNAHGGLLTVLIDPRRMKVGPHRVSAKITMKASSSTAKAARATRALTVVHCASAVVTPHFTG
ncbi:MAG TPA: hypothetical protein VGG08_11490 [Solirubrobacteraceae bacterium]|jgi:hypothetical protein